MNILFYFISQINPRCGGTERVADNIAHGLRSRGHNVYYLSRTKVPGEYDIPCYFLPDEQGVTDGNIFYINELCKDLQIDIIINEAGNTDDVYMISKEHIPDVRIITELHFCPMQTFRYYYRSLHFPLSLKTPKASLINILKWIKAPYNRHRHWNNMCKRYRYMYNNSHEVVVLSPAYIKEFADIAKLYDTEHLTAIYNPNTFSSVTSSKNKEKMVLSIGRLEFSPKKIDYLLKIWEKIQPSHTDWTLCICGEGSARFSLEYMVKTRRIQGVRFEGNVNPQSYYERASILCMTSIYEGTPMVIVEAMQCGAVPVVYDTFAAAKDMIANGIDGYLIQPFDDNDYARKISELMENTQLRNAMSKKAEQSTTRFDIELILDKWELLLR